MKSKYLLSALVILSAFFGGCATPPPFNFTPKEVPQAKNREDSELKSIIITVAQHNEKKGEIDFAMDYSKTVPELWKTGLEDAINRALIFKDSGPIKVNLRVKILEWDMPAMGASMTTKTTALYEIQDRETGKTLFSKELSTDGRVGATYAFAGYVRAIESANRAVQNNIIAFLKVLDEQGLESSKSKDQ